MIYWAPFLHFYQPPTQYKPVLDRIAKESYAPLLKVFKAHPESRITINISGVLTEMLSDYGYKSILSNMGELAEKGQLEFVESAKYHAILPLIPPKEAIRQIELNNKTNSYYFKSSYKPRGFFLPEMCYSDAAASIVSKKGYEWVIVSGVSCPDGWPLDVIYNAGPKAGGIKVFFRDDIISNRISFRSVDPKGFVHALKDLAKDREDIYVVTAMDGETFGHHIRDWENLFLGELYEMLEKPEYADDIKVVNVSALLKEFPVKRSKPPEPSSWSTTKEEIAKGNYYPLWQDPANKIHALQWDHLEICFEILREAARKRHNDKSKKFFILAREALDKALHSCQFWWANKPRKLWNENMINKGLVLQEEVIFNAYKAIELSGARESERKSIYYSYVAPARYIAGKILDAILI
ncbi:MAG: hypothetical protein WC569_06475 [Candidatus Omnitrophota bacterium]